jgi:hypothetical protein
VSQGFAVCRANSTIHGGHRVGENSGLVRSPIRAAHSQPSYRGRVPAQSRRSECRHFGGTLSLQIQRDWTTPGPRPQSAGWCVSKAWRRGKPRRLGLSNMYVNRGRPVLRSGCRGELYGRWIVRSDQGELADRRRVSAGLYGLLGSDHSGNTPIQHANSV